MEMKLKLMPCLPAYPGSPKTFPKFVCIDNRPPSEHEKMRALLKLTSDELGLIIRLRQDHGDLPVFRRLQVRQMSSILDSFFGTLNYYSIQRSHQGELVISQKEINRIEGRSGIMDFYKTSIKVYARAMGVTSPLGNKLQVTGAVEFWPALRGRITHPRSLEQYQFTGCDSVIMSVTVNWFKRVREWALHLELQKIEDTKKQVHKSMSDLKDYIRGVNKQGIEDD